MHGKKNAELKNVDRIHETRARTHAFRSTFSRNAGRRIGCFPFDRGFSEKRQKRTMLDARRNVSRLKTKWKNTRSRLSRAFVLRITVSDRVDASSYNSSEYIRGDPNVGRNNINCLAHRVRQHFLPCFPSTGQSLFSFREKKIRVTKPPCPDRGYYLLHRCLHAVRNAYKYHRNEECF